MHCSADFRFPGMPIRRYHSWGRIGPAATRAVRLPPGGPDRLPEGTVLAYGNGRSYGDACLNRSGTLLDTRALDRILHFDPDTGVLRCEAGVLLSDILQLIVPAGWFLPVTPGTKFITVGGAIANDVHGKNHHRAGTFGCHIARLELLRSDGRRIVCGPDRDVEWFRATVGGLGLTGLILEADLRLRRIPGRAFHVETTRFGNLSEFFRLSAEADRTHEYTVAWIDCLAGGASQGRGWFAAGNPAESPGGAPRRRRSLRIPVDPPFSLVNRLSLRLFNTVYYHRPVPRRAVVDFEPFFYPLDALLEWNRIYGPSGFYQFQCVVPPGDGEAVVRALLAETARVGEGSFLVVLKQFGTLPSPGLLSFPRPGPTLALDFPNRGDRTRRLLGRLERLVDEAGGAIYPAKDACMSPAAFQRAFPAWTTLESLRDPAFTSDFWRRVTGQPEGAA